MKSTADFESFYKEKMLPELEKLEVRRKRFLTRKQLLFILVVLFLGLHAGVILLKIKQIAPYVPVWSFFITAFFVPTLAFIVYRKFIIDYTLASDVRKLLIRETMHFMIDDAETDSDKFVDYQVFADSKILTQKPIHYTGSGLTTGNLGDIKVTFSNIQMGAYRVKKPAQGIKSWNIMFQGLFFVGDFGDQFKGTTLVVPDRSEKVHGFVGAELKKNNAYRGQNVQFRKHPRFSEYYAVYSDVPQEARQILSEDLINRFLRFTEKINTNLYLSCTANKIYVGLHLEGSEFAFSYNSPIPDFQRISAYYQELIFVFEIIHTLNKRLVPQ